MTDQKPTVGRVVHYYDPKCAPVVVNGPFAALITSVHSDTCISLAVFPPHVGYAYVASSSMRKDVAGDALVYWEWPPCV